MDEYVNFVVPFNLPIPCLSICDGLYEFLVPSPMIDPLMLLPHDVITHVK
jgi:hypothetical protein